MHKRALDFRAPLLNAAGSLGFAPDGRGPVALDALGAFVTNPISRGRRKAAQDSRQEPHPKGLLLHSGWPNPGLTTSLKRFSSRWERADLPIIVHLLGSEAPDLRRMAPRV
ncbi:MAG: hypothetical protein DWG76_08105, partial [Chloroflexi bacterium]|nr:hypothetical protein [Chloroflexota bacterium]